MKCVAKENIMQNVYKCVRIKLLFYLNTDCSAVRKAHLMKHMFFETIILDKFVDTPLDWFASYTIVILESTFSCTKQTLQIITLGS